VPQLAEAGEEEPGTCKFAPPAEVPEERGTGDLVPPAEVPEAQAAKAGHEVMSQLVAPSNALIEIDVEDSDASEGDEPAG